MTADPDPPANPAPSGSNLRTLWLGAATGLALPLACALGFQNKSVVLGQSSLLLFVASLTLWPLAAIVLACLRSTRRFGLGMLLGLGLGWLALLAICGGMLLKKN